MGDKAERFASILLRTTDEDASVSQLIDEHAVETLKWLEAQHYIRPPQYRSAFNAEGEVTGGEHLRGILYRAVFKNGSERLEDMFNALPAKAQRAILATAYRDFATPESEKDAARNSEQHCGFLRTFARCGFANAKNFEEARKATMAWLQQMQFDFRRGSQYHVRVNILILPLRWLLCTRCRRKRLFSRRLTKCSICCKAVSSPIYIT